MSRYVVLGLVVGGLQIVSCGGSGSVDGGTVDGGQDGGTNGSCNVVAQTGCDVAEKCAAVIVADDPFDGQIRCVPDGTVQKGDACTYGDSGPEGYDNCRAGLQCVGSECEEICNVAPDSCPSPDGCVPTGDIFDEQEGVGTCSFRCDPLTQDCSGDEACYLVVESGAQICGLEAAVATQGDDCVFTNGCTEGYGCVLPTSPEDSTLTCAFFCDPEEGPPTCTEGPGPSFECRRITEFYSDADNVSTALGMCVDPLIFPSS